MSQPAELPLFKTVSNAGVCSWFYFMFILNVVAFGLGAIGYMYMYLRLRGLSLPLKLVFIAVTLIVMALPLVNAGFFYTMCNRALGVSTETNQ